MAVIEGGISGALADVGVAVSAPLHVSPKPTPYGALGHYMGSAQTGTIAAGMAANGEIFHCRWTDATRFAIIYEVGITGFEAVTGFTAGAVTMRLSFARAWSADGSGGTAWTLTGDNLQLRSSMGASLFGAIRISTTGALTAGTKTFDTQDLMVMTGRVDAVAAKHFIPQSNVVTTQSPAFGGGLLVLFSRDPGSEHPIVLAQNEGIVVRATVPATGTHIWTVYMKWCEVTAY